MFESSSSYHWLLAEIGILKFRVYILTEREMFGLSFKIYGYCK